MREVFVSQDHARVGFHKSILDQAGIPNFVRNECTNNSLTELPSPLFFPTLCVIDHDDYDQAMQILGDIYNAPPSQVADWSCAKCNEDVPGNFDSCWQCGALRVAPVDASESGGSA